MVKDNEIFKNPKNKCEECVCKDGNIDCYSLCNDTIINCKSYGLNDPYEYKWIKPQDNECCGHCIKTSN